MRIGFLAGLDFQRWEAGKVADTLARIGYEGVEWTLAHFDPRASSARELRDRVQATTSHGLAISAVVVQRSYVWTEADKRLAEIDFTIECLRRFADLGIPAVNLFTGPIPWDAGSPRVGKQVSEGEAWDMAFRAFDTIVPCAEECGVTLAVEGVFGMLAHDFYTTRFLFERYRSDRMGVNYDPSHGVLYGNTDAGWAVRQWGSQIAHVHLKDAVGTPEKFLFPLLGEGEVDWDGLFTALQEIGYGGFCSVEFESFAYYRRVLGSDPAEAARVSLAAVRRLLEGGARFDS